MKIALLNEKIVIQKNAVKVDDIGNRKNTWIDYFFCFATIGGEGGNEKEDAGQTVYKATITFSVRYCNALADVVPTQYRILFCNEIYNIPPLLLKRLYQNYISENRYG